MAIFSFHPVKGITSGEGGMVTTRDERLRDRLALFRTHGITRPRARTRAPGSRSRRELGFNYRLTDIQAALASSQLRRLDDFITRRNAVADRYREGLDDLDAADARARRTRGRTPRAPPVRHPPPRRRRRPPRALRRACTSAACLPRSTTSRSTGTRTTARPTATSAGLCPEAERYYAGCISLPCFPDLTAEDQDYVIAAVRDLV